MSRRPLIVALSAALAVALTTAGITAATAATPDPNTIFQYTSTAGATKIDALGSTVTSDLTSKSGVSGTTFPASNGSTVATANVDGILKVGAVSTTTNAQKYGSTIATVAQGKTAGVDLLNGLIKVDAVDTYSWAKRIGTTLGGDASTTFVKLEIAGKAIPVNVPTNTKIEIPGVAKIVLNESKTVVNGPSVTVNGSALRVELLKPAGDAPIGTAILINPVYSALKPVAGANTTPVSGYAYGTKVKVNVGSKVVVDSAPTAYSTLPQAGTYGYTIKNTTLGVDVPGLLSTGTVESTNNSTSVPVTADVTNANTFQRLDLLNGLITADAVLTIAKAKKAANGTITTEGQMALAKLKVGNVRIPINPKPNLTVNLAVARVVVNEQIKTASGITVTALHITILKGVAGLDAGAEIWVSVANSAVG